MLRDRTCSFSPMLCSIRFAKQVSLMICLLVACPGLDNGTEAFCANAPAVFRGAGLVLSKPGRATKLTNKVCTLRSRAPRLQPAAFSLQMGGDSWLDRAIDKLLGDDVYDQATLTETTDGSSGYYVVLQDDDSHTVDEVVKIVRKVIGCSWKDALDSTLEVGRQGWSVVKEGGQEECELARAALQNATLKAAVLDEEAMERKREESVEEQKAGTNCPHCDARWQGKQFRNGNRPRVTVIGATGRVGAWTVRELTRFCKGDVDFVVAGRNEDAANKLLKQLSGGQFVLGGREWATMRTKLLGTAEFQAVDLGDFPSLVAAIQKSDLVIHTAGPFQGATPEVLRAAIACGTPYMDVCDDVEYSQRARAMSDAASAEGVTAVTTCGIYPGLSNVMAAAAVRNFEKEAEFQSGAAENKAETLEFSYFTAGTGGVGATILASTFLLLAEKCQVFEKGEMREREPLSLEREVDFGERIGKHRVMLLNLPEVVSAHQVLKVPNVNAAFATAPKFWNLASMRIDNTRQTLLKALVQIVPRKLLGNRNFANNFAKISLPVNRLVDAFVGSAAGIKVDVSGGGHTTSSLWTGKYLSQAVGVATAAMAMEILESEMPTGVLFPEEAIPPERTTPFLDRACKGALDLDLRT